MNDNAVRMTEDETPANAATQWDVGPTEDRPKLMRKAGTPPTDGCNRATSILPMLVSSNCANKPRPFMKKGQRGLAVPVRGLRHAQSSLTPQSKVKPQARPTQCRPSI